MSEVNLIVLLHAKSGKEAQLRENLVALVDPSRRETGNIRYDLFSDTNDAGRFVFVETWSDTQAQRMHHTESEHIRRFHEHGESDVDSRELVILLERLV